MLASIISSSLRLRNLVVVVATGLLTFGGQRASGMHSMIHDSFMSRANSIVIPGAKLDLAMQLILTPFVLQLVERHRRAG
jgi:phosphoribulokinase